MADLFTKCLGSHLFEKRRRALGFEPRDVPVSMMCFGVEDNDGGVIDGIGDRSFGFVEVCCEPNSQLAVWTLKGGISYIGIVKDVQSPSLLSEVSQHVSDWIRSGKWVHVHVSTPCASGSPLKHLTSGDVTVSDLEWESIMKAVGGFLSLGNSRPFELPFHNSIWSRPLTQKVLIEAGLSHCCQVYLCQCGVRTSHGKPIGKSLCFSASHFTFCRALHSKFGFCSCEEHASMSEINSSTARYPEKLARGILSAVKAAMRDP